LKNRGERPLFIVYDEGHNLSDQQTDLLLELKPKNKDFITRVDTGKVVEAGLVKKIIKLAAYETPMEETVSSLVEDLKQIKEQIKITNLPNEKPKAIYVLEKCGVKPENIAVYCDLKFAKNYPKPPEFKLFSGGGEKKYQEFIAGDYQHIIFNLGLQEGWDDPLVYAAYIDRFINSKIAVKQIIGRVLRQPKPNITHQLPEMLNTAHFYIQIEKQSAFQEVIEEVNQELQQTAPEIEVKVVSSTEKPELVKVQGDYEDKEKTQGTGYRSITKKYIDEQGNTQQILREKIGETSRTTARAIFFREIIRKLPQARGVFCLDEPKFDALVENSCLEQSSVENYKIPDILLYNPQKSLPFKNSLHERYSQLNKLETEFAQELDKFADNVIAIDTSGEHLIKDKTDRKLLNILPSNNNSPHTLVRFISKGKWNKEVEKIDDNDIIVRFQAREGKYTPFLLGWDAHGLPTEHKMLQIHKDKKNNLRPFCHQFALEQAQIQREQLKKLGLFTDYDKYYITSDKNYEAEQLRVFAELVRKNLVYQGFRPIYWSCGHETALAEAEIEYYEKKDTSLYFKIRLADIFFGKENVKNQSIKNTSIAEGQKWHRQKLKIEKIFLGEKLLGLTYFHPYRKDEQFTASLLKDIQGYIVDGSDFIKEGEGTGLVHLAPAFGAEDFSVAKKEKLMIECPLEPNGVFNEKIAIPELVGKHYSE
ncbi:27556_t:CDS:2, partial [Racocetra persica]